MNNRTSTTRIARTAAAAIAVSAALLAGCSGGNKDEASGGAAKGAETGELHVYTWSDYMATEFIEAFEAKYGCKVVIDTYDSNEAMYAKLKAGGSGYDVIIPSSYMIGAMAREGLIVPLDHSKLPNVRKNFDKSFESQVLDPTFKYNVPYAITYTGLCVDKTKIPEGVDVATWKVLENGAFRGKVTLLDDYREVIGAGLMSLGYSLNSQKAEEIDAAVAEVLKWKKNIRKFDAESYKTEVPSGATWIGHGYSTDVRQVIDGDEEEDMPPCPNIEFVLPREGFTIACDEMVLSSKAPNPDLAYKFMDFLYEGENAKVNMEYLLGPNPVKPAIDALDQEFRDSIIPPAEAIKAGQVLGPVDDAMAIYQKAWDRIKATSAN
ncbi:MAG: spermidine/putrescine ABC transporter substrate-binding protein [Kiritimatiellae bacterium]|nr:spermidine/putrescine ABC transporter substrate-binding protein [Kiritimatiellia bacterium]